MTEHERGSVSSASQRPEREVRAVFDDEIVRVYQAFSPAIAEPALVAQTFVAPFKRGRMTWIKPSFTWMMHRSAWGASEGQERVLAIDIRRDGLDWALAHSCISHFDPTLFDSPDAWKREMRTAPVRIQWDPERSIRMEVLPWRTIQIGLSGDAVARYLDRWIVRLEDVTGLAGRVRAAVDARDVAEAERLRPPERRYPLPGGLAQRIGCVE